MKITCDVIRDLLPLYVEELLSEDSRELVEEHIESCDKCREELESLKEPSEMAMDIDVEPFKEVKKKLFKLDFMKINLTAILLMILVIMGINYLTKPIYLPYSSQYGSISVGEDYEVFLNTSEKLAGYEVESLFTSGNPSELSISYWDSKLNMILNKIDKNRVGESILINSKGQRFERIWYYSGGNGVDKLLYGLNPCSENGGCAQLTLPRLALTYYLLMSLICIFILGLLLLIFKKYEMAKKVLTRIILIPISYLLATFGIKGVNFISYNMIRDFYFILALGVFIYLGILSILKLRQAKKDNKV